MTTTTELRPELKQPLPERMRELPVHRGYPVPWFVAWVDGEPEFRAMDGRRWRQAVAENRCWVCGQHLGANLAFVVGPMCLVTGTTSEPPCHLDCATWSAINCPFLSRPRMVRRENDLPEQTQDPAGIGLERNPGCVAVYTTTNYKLFDDGKGKQLIEMSRDYRHVEWYAEGRPATRAEIEHSVDTGIPLLLEACGDEGPEARAELDRRRKAFNRLLPRQ